MTPIFRREVHLGHFNPGESKLLRTVLGAFRMGSCVANCRGHLVTTASTVVSGGASVEIRYSEELALSTEIANRGTFEANIYESDCLVATLAGGKSMQMVMAGKGRLTAKCQIGTLIDVTTHLRCPCGFPGEPYSANQDVVAPIGSFLL